MRQKIQWGSVATFLFTGSVATLAATEGDWSWALALYALAAANAICAFWMAEP